MSIEFLTKHSTDRIERGDIMFFLIGTDPKGIYTIYKVNRFSGITLSKNNYKGYSVAMNAWDKVYKGLV